MLPANILQYVSSAISAASKRKAEKTCFASDAIQEKHAAADGGVSNFFPCKCSPLSPPFPVSLFFLLSFSLEKIIMLEVSLSLAEKVIFTLQQHSLG